MKSLKKIVVVIALIVLLLGVTLLFSLKKTSIKGSIINEDIEKISIKYYPFYNIATAESFNELEETGNYIDPVEFDLNSDDLKKVSAIINGLKETDFDFESCNCFYMMDMYELVLNDKYVLSMGDEFGFLKENSEIIFDVPNDLKNIIDKIMLDYNEEKLYKKISSKKISVDIDNNVLNIKDQNAIDTINKYK